MMFIWILSLWAILIISALSTLAALTVMVLFREGCGSGLTSAILVQSQLIVIIPSVDRVDLLDLVQVAIVDHCINIERRYFAQVLEIRHILQNLLIIFNQASEYRSCFGPLPHWGSNDPAVHHAQLHKFLQLGVRVMNNVKQK
jgi:hypothetical protein